MAMLALLLLVAQAGPPGPLRREERKLLKPFDKDGNGWLDRDERQPAREAAKQAPQNRQPRFPGRPPGGPAASEPAKPGRRLVPSDVRGNPTEGFYDPAVLRTIFLRFENTDWEKELEDFHGTDVEVPATMIVDGKTYANVGVKFRGMSSYMGVSAGYKRSFNVSVDLADSAQRVQGYKTLNLLNSHDDPSFLSTVLYSAVARNYIPAPKANLVRVVINDECWGVYVNAQQFDKIFVAENFGESKGVRWKVGGSPMGKGGLDYAGEDIEPYKQRYELKSGDKEKAWKDLIALCKTLSETPLDKLEAALDPILDIEGALRFLALDVVLVNNDGYWTRASDYSLYQDEKGRFHVVPHDMNEAFKGAHGGPGGGGRRGPPPGFGGPPGSGPRAGGVDLDPLVGLDDARKPLRSRLLAVPSLRARYLNHVRAIAEERLNGEWLGKLIAKSRDLIQKEVEADTRKLSSFDAFKAATSTELSAPGAPLNLRSFAERRRTYLLSAQSLKAFDDKAKGATR